jgi:hypothetical protein
MSEKLLVIYHGGCDDGFAAAWSVHSALGPQQAEFVEAHYQQGPPDVSGRYVLIVDFSYKRPVLVDMATRAKGIIVLDHHLTAAQDLFGFPEPPPFAHWRDNGWDAFGAGIAALFDMNRSGAGMTWDYFFTGRRPACIDYIEDRDLWRKALPGIEEFTSALRSYPKDFALWDDLMGDGPEPLISEGKAIHRFYRQLVEKMKTNARQAVLLGVPIWITNAPSFAASEVAGELAERGGKFGATYYELADGRWSYSLRSRGDYDVSFIAKALGGGGHKNAAGFTSDHRVHDITTF